MSPATSQLVWDRNEERFVLEGISQLQIICGNATASKNLLVVEVD